MADTPPVAQSAKLTSTPALITFWLLIQWAMIGGSKLLIVLQGIKLDATLQGFLSNFEGTTQNLLIMAVSFWVGSSVGAKASGDALAERGKQDSAALATIAGAAPVAAPAPVRSQDAPE